MEHIFSITQIISMKVNATQEKSPKTLYHYTFKNKDARNRQSQKKIVDVSLDNTRN